jgi:hypothetical protein
LSRVFALLLIPTLANAAGAVYEVAVRPVDENNLTLSGTPAAPVITHCFTQDGMVRVDGASAKVSYLFKDRTMYVVDNASRTVHVLKAATLGQVTAHYADAVKQLQEAAANAPPEERAAATQKADQMKAVSERLRDSVPRDFRLTTRFESVDGRACRIWEERESGAKRLELCVAPVASIPGGADILGGMKTLSQFREGSEFAFAVDFGLSDWWPDIAALRGVPLLIREYKYDSVVREVMLTGMRSGVPGTSTFDPPAGFQIQEGPEYALWYMH